MANPSHTIRTKNMGPFKRREIKDTKSKTDSEKLDKDEDSDALKKPPEYKLHVHPKTEMWILWGMLGTYSCFLLTAYKLHKIRKRAKIRNRYNQAPHLTQDTNGKVTTSQLDITNESQEVSPFPAGDHNASTNRRA